MTTLKEIRRGMLEREPELLGKVLSATSITTTTVVFIAAVLPALSEQAYANKWIVRGDATDTADRVRYPTTYTPSTFTITHATTNYQDTTGSGEIIEIHNFDPMSFDLAIQEMLRTTKRLDITILPGVGGAGHQWLQDLDWIESPADILQITRTGSPVLSRDRYFQQWNSYSSGALQPDYWTLAGSGGTWARSETMYTTDLLREGRKWGLEVTRSGTNVTVEQVVGLLFGGVDSTSLQGETVTVFGRVKAPSSATSARLYIHDGTTQTYSDYHTGGDGVEELTKAIALGASATQLRFGLSLEQDETVELSQLGLVYASALDDAHRYDNYPEYTVWSGGGNRVSRDVPIDLEPIGRGSQYVVRSLRAYPTFTDSRIQAGTADADTTDIPLSVAVPGALYHLFRNMSGDQHTGTTRFSALAADYRVEWDSVKRNQMGAPSPSQPRWRRGAYASAASR